MVKRSKAKGQFKVHHLLKLSSMRMMSAKVQEKIEEEDEEEEGDGMKVITMNCSKHRRQGAHSISRYQSGTKAKKIYM